MKLRRKNSRLLLQLAIHGIVGIMIVQFTYFMGIAEGDAAKRTDIIFLEALPLFEAE